MPESPPDETYWDLVQQLMQHGWYRVGQGPAHDLDRVMWGFREGHVLAQPAPRVLWIPARDEICAMRVLIEEIERLLDKSEVPDMRGATLATAANWHPDDVCETSSQLSVTG